MPPLELECVEVSEQTRNYLLRRAIKDSRRAIKGSTRLLAQLQSIRPDVAQDFTIRQARRVEAPFRLLFDHRASGETLPEQSVTSFIALTYCWHDGKWEPHEYLGRRQRHRPISTPMFSGLLAERQSQNEGVWIDQLCIDQKNASEKIHAIGCMDLIYKSARKVVAVLEDIALSTREEVWLRGLLNDKDLVYSELPEGDKKDLILLLFRILSARWFKRAWCSHELQISSTVVFFLPTIQGIFSMTAESLEDLYSMTREFQFRYPDVRESYEAVESFDFLTRSPCVQAEGYLDQKSLLCQFNDNMKLACTIVTDKISLSINIAGLQFLYMGGEKSSDQCRWTLAMIALAAGEAIVLCGVEAALFKYEISPPCRLESWLRWYDEVEDPMIDFGGSKLEQPPCISIANEFVASFDLFALGKPTSRPRLCSIRTAAKFIAEYLRLCKDSDDYLSLVQDSETEETYFSADGILSEIFACSIECGSSWMIRQASSSRKVAQITRQRLQERKFDLWPAVHDMLCGANDQGVTKHESFSEGDRISILQYVYFVLFYKEAMRPSRSQCGSGMFDENDSTRFHCSIAELGPEDRGLVIYGSGTMKPPIRERITAIPVALSGWSCALVSRLWILERIPDIDHFWRIVEKLPVFCLAPILARGSEVVRLPHQVICGILDIPGRNPSTVAGGANPLLPVTQGLA